MPKAALTVGVQTVMDAREVGIRNQIAMCIHKHTLNDNLYRYIYNVDVLYYTYRQYKNNSNISAGSLPASINSICMLMLLV